MIRIRPTGIFIKDAKILLMRRVRNDQVYFVFPGGHIEGDESVEDTFLREMKEELSFNVEKFREIYKIIQYNCRDDNKVEHIFYLVKKFSGKLKLGGPEVKRMKKGKNDYYPTWYSKYEFEKLDPVYPIGIKEYILGKGFIK